MMCEQKLYFQTAGEPDLHNGQLIGMLVNGEELVDSARDARLKLTTLPFLHFKFSMSMAHLFA